MDYKIKGTWKMLGRQCVHARCSKYMDVRTFDVESFADVFLGLLAVLLLRNIVMTVRCALQLLMMFFAQAEFLLCRSFDRQFRQRNKS